MIGKFKILLLLMLFSLSCQKHDWDNPFDPDCPKEIFTPSNFKAEQQYNIVKLSWNQSNSHISGFKIERKVGDGFWEEVASLDVSTTAWNDDKSTSDKLNEYRLYALAGNNSSNSLTTQITPFLSGATGTFTDLRDGKVYKWVRIGTQIWLAENLAYLPSVNPSTASSLSITYCFVYGYDGTNILEAKASSNYSLYGVLYNWYAALTACPSGWHLPTDFEWIILENYLGGSSVVGGKIKSITGWEMPNTGASNSSGFSGLPAGSCSTDIGHFYYIGKYAGWWSSTESSTIGANGRYLQSDSANLFRSDFGKVGGFSIRCVRD